MLPYKLKKTGQKYSKIIKDNSLTRENFGFWKTYTDYEINV